MERLRQDLRFGVRMLARHRGFTAAALLMLALGIGSNVVVFTLAETMYFKRLRVPQADRLVGIYGTSATNRNLALSLNEFRYVRDHSRTLTEVAAHYSNAPINLVDRGESREINGSVVTGSFFPLLRLQPALGRFFLVSEDSVPGRDPVAVISYGLWQLQFDGDPGVLGRSIRLNGTGFTIVGVAPRGFAGVTEGGLATEVWMPSAMFRVGYRYCDAVGDPDCRIVRLIGRLAPGASVRDSETELNGLASQLAAAYPRVNRGRGIDVDALQGATRELDPDESSVPILLAAAVAAVLLIACANLAGLMLARSMTRTREMAIRLALGASRSRVVRQLMTEALLLAVIGGGLGLLLAFWAKDLLGGFYAFNVEGQRANFPLEIDAAAVLFTMGISLLTILFFGLFPALQTTRRDLVPSLKKGATTTATSRLRAVLVAAQIACCIMLLVGAALLLRSVTNIYRGPGFNPNGVLLVRLRPSLVAQDPARAESFQREVIRRLEQLPGVASASPAQFPPLRGWGGLSSMWLPGHAPAPDQVAYRTAVNGVGPRYLKTIELPLVRGRDFTDQDRKDTPRVAIVNEVVARAFWPDRDPVGASFVLDGATYRIVGVARTAEYRSGAEAPGPLVYVDYWQRDAVGRDPIDSRTHVRVNGDVARMLPIVKREIMSVDSTVPISEDRPLTEWLGYFFRPVRAAASAVGFFAGLALLLSVVGLYAVVSAGVTQRTREVALRVALGASPRDVGELFLRQGLVLVAAGGAGGMLASVAGSRLLSAYLYGIGARDPLAIGAAVAILTATALLASYLPARRAMNIDPIAELRN